MQWILAETRTQRILAELLISRITSYDFPLAKVKAHLRRMENGLEYLQASKAKPAVSLKEDEIRVLKLFPGISDAPIQCELHVASLNKDPEYETISYRWGDAHDTSMIEVGNTSIAVTKTLKAALLRLRFRDRPRSLWVDQLCIDQSDHEERIHQVRMMDQIYRKCSHCVIWFGEINVDYPGIENAQNAFELVEHMAHPEQSTHPAAVESDKSFEGTMQGIEAMSVQGHPWWQRVWTLQEAVLPTRKTIIWGHLKLAWSTLIRAFQQDYSYELRIHLNRYVRADRPNPNPLKELLLHAFWANNTLSKSNSTEILLHTLVIHRPTRNATDPVDRVFGYLGLVGDTPFPNTYKCDYSTPPGYLYGATTLDLILLHGMRTLLVLNPRAIPGKGTPNIARWAVDLAGHTAPAVDSYYLHWGYDFYNACNSRPLCAEYLMREAQHSQGRFDVLGMSGHKAGTIACVSEDSLTFGGHGGIFPSNNPNLHALLKTWREFAWKHVQSFRPATDRTEFDKDFATYMLGNAIRNHELWVVREPTEADLAGALAWLDNEQTMDLPAEIWPGGKPLYAQTCNQKFFVTNKGLFGVGHAELQVEDEVWIFDGGNYPFIVRPRPATVNSVDNQGDGISDSIDVDYVGFAYVQGLMFAEFFCEDCQGEVAPSKAQEVRIH